MTTKLKNDYQIKPYFHHNT